MFCTRTHDRRQKCAAHVLVCVAIVVCAARSNAQVHMYDDQKMIPRFMDSVGLWVDLASGVGFVSTTNYTTVVNFEIALHVKPFSSSTPILSFRYAALPQDNEATHLDVRAELFVIRTRASALVAGVGYGSITYLNHASYGYYSPKSNSWLIPFSLRALLPFMNGGSVSIQGCAGFTSEFTYFSLNLGLWLGSKTYPI